MALLEPEDWTRLQELGWIETQRRRVVVRNPEALRTRAASRLR